MDLSFHLTLLYHKTGHTMDRAKGAGKQGGPRGWLMTSGMLSRSRQEHYLSRRGSGDMCATGTGARLLRES